MKKTETTNVFTNGLMMDINPLVTPNNVLSNALNATLITRNGNEQALQNDMGNCRVETAYLPEGYIPLGTAQLGGIIYIVSYNPLINKCQIGSFPSPERNLTSDEYSDSNQRLSSDDFLTDVRYEFSTDGQYISDAKIQSSLAKKQISSNTLHSGDKYIVGATGLVKTDGTFNNIVELNTVNKYVKLSLATIDSNGRLVYLTTQDKYNLTENEDSNKKYFIYNGAINSNTSTNLDDYRSVVNSPFQIFSSKIAGNLWVIAELQVIDTFDITYKWVGYEELGEESKYTFKFQATTTPDDIGIKYVQLHDFTNSNGNENNILIGELPINNLKLFYERDENDSTNDLSFELDMRGIRSKIGGNTQFTITPCMPFGRYSQLDSTITINFDLIGSGEIQNTTWRYYKQDESMYLLWDINVYPKDNQKINSIAVLAYEFNEDFSNIATYSESEDSLNLQQDIHTIIYKSNRNSYSGIYSDNIQFSNNFKPNTLYFVKIVIEYYNLDSLKFEYKSYLKVLYTNGVFNQTYLDGQVLDFDDQSIELTCKTDFETSKVADLVNTSVIPELMSTSSLGTNLHGYDKYTCSNQKEVIKGTVGFENSFDTYTVNNDNIQLNVVDDSTTFNAQKEFSIKSTDDSFNDEWIQDNNVEESETSDKDYFNAALIEQSNSEITFQLNGAIFNKVSANTEKRQVNVTNYMAPVVYDEQTLSKYNISIRQRDDDGSISCTWNSRYYSLGISAGGKDNEGTNSAYYCFGQRTLTQINEEYNNEYPVDGPYKNLTNKRICCNSPEVLTENGHVDSDNIMTIMPDITGLMTCESTIVPVILSNIGNRMAYVRDSSNTNDPNSKNDKYIDYFTEGTYENRLESSDMKIFHTFFIDSTEPTIRIDGNRDENRYVAFKDTYKTPFITVQLFIKGQDGLFYPTNNYFGLRDVNESIKACNGDMDRFGSRNPRWYWNGRSLSNVIAELLCQLYVKHDILTTPAYTVKDIQYYQSLQTTWNVKFTYSISGVKSEESTDYNNILFNGDTMQKVISNGRNFGLDTSKNCFNIILKNTNNIDYTHSHTVKLGSPSVLNKFIETKNNATIDTYIKNLSGTDLIKNKATVISQSKVYKIVDGIFSEGVAAYQSELIQDDDGTIRAKNFTYDNSDNGGSLLALDSIGDKIDSYFYWDYREQKICLSKQATIQTIYLMYFRPDKDSYDSIRRTTEPDIKLFENCNII